MKLTKLLREWLVESCDVKADATDDEFRKAAGDAIVSGKLSAAKLAELNKEPDEDEANEFAKKMDAIADGLGKLTETLVKERTETKEEVKEEKKEEVKEEKKEESTKEKAQPSAMSKMISSLGGTPDETDGEKSIDIRVKEAAEMYGTTKTALTYPSETKAGHPHQMAGRPVMDYSEAGKAMDTASERDMAVAGAYAKMLCATAQKGGSRMFGFQSLPQHDKELLLYGMENMKWGGCGPNNTDHNWADIVNRKLTPTEQKAIIDESSGSGGMEAAPIVFDDLVIQAPLLHGELYPLITVIPLDRGRRVEGVATGTVTGGWGGIDDTAVTLFTTTSYITAFNTTIFRWEGAIRIGLDFLSDTPIDFGAHITQQYGERLLEDLDDVIADGDGSTQPEGIRNKSGITSSSWGGATSIGNYESLRFAVPKNEMRPNVAGSAVFCGTETSYQRAKALPVAAADARRLFAGASTNVGTYDDYAIMGRPYKINESLANTEIFFAVMSRYRMYRRRGLTIRTSTEGDTLIRNNEMLMVAMARYGGQLERGASAALTTTAPA